MNAEFIDDLKDMVERGFQAQIDSMNNGNAEHMSEIYLPEKLHLFCNPQVRSDRPVKDLAQLNIIKRFKPYHSPFLTQAQPVFCPIFLPYVADPRAGPAKNYLYRILYMPQELLDEFIKMADDNTTNNLETCGIIAGKLENKVFNISTLIIPKQTSTSDRCETEHEEEISEFVLKNELISLGWIHMCFMSSIDLHTQCSYQELIPEAIAIVMCPRIKKHDMFHLSCPVGLKVIIKCDKKDFHDHDIPDDGSFLYEYCSHVELVKDMKCMVVAL